MSAIIYDPAVFKKAGVAEPKINWTWDDYDNTVEQVYKATGVKSAPLFYGSIKTLWEYVERCAGKSMYNKDGTTLGFTSTKEIEDMKICIRAR